jgi:hypothetical protein
LSFRINQLKNFKDGLEKFENELAEAVRKDLAREAFVTWFAEISVLKSEIAHTLTHL